MYKIPINDKKEQWADIDGYVNYEISTYGNVRNCRTGKMLKQKINADGYFIVKFTKNGKHHRIHRLVAIAFLNNPHNKPQVDHIDGNRKNNSISNLRFATCSENSMNKTKQKNTSSTYKGVTFHKGIQKWCAQIKRNGKLQHIGVYKKEKEAARAYNEKAKELFGEYAKLNEIKSEWSESQLKFLKEYLKSLDE